MLLTSVQHGGFGDVDGGVPGLKSESRQYLLGFGVDLVFPFSVSSVLSLFMVQ